ncbi:hypothetical protein GCM10022278_10510 [Allohahella marinimesophila]|uniref:Uncharacterized protein n=1 Tax=Allohahella marinimesophila TaxID=1054972 RepID=A0ABP7NT29_9GAMM
MSVIIGETYDVSDPGREFERALAVFARSLKFAIDKNGLARSHPGDQCNELPLGLQV